MSAAVDLENIRELGIRNLRKAAADNDNAREKVEEKEDRRIGAARLRTAEKQLQVGQTNVVALHRINTTSASGFVSVVKAQQESTKKIVEALKKAQNAIENADLAGGGGIGLGPLNKTKLGPGASKLTKFLRFGTTLTGGTLGFGLTAFDSYQKKDVQSSESAYLENAIIGAIGGTFVGGLKGAIGGAIAGVVGTAIGRNWDEAVDLFSAKAKAVHTSIDKSVSDAAAATEAARDRSKEMLNQSSIAFAEAIENFRKKRDEAEKDLKKRSADHISSTLNPALPGGSLMPGIPIVPGAAGLGTPSAPLPGGGAMPRSANTPFEAPPKSKPSEAFAVPSIGDAANPSASVPSSIGAPLSLNGSMNAGPDLFGKNFSPDTKTAPPFGAGTTDIPAALPAPVWMPPTESLPSIPVAGGSPSSASAALAGPRTGTGQPSLGLKPDAVPGDIFGRRQKFASELSDPAIVDRMLALTMSENNTPQGRKAVAETIFNRADAHGKSLSSTMNPAYYEPMQNGSYARNLALLQSNPALREKLLKETLEPVLKGSNESNFGTHNASAGVAERAKASQTVTAEITGETYTRKDNPSFKDLHGAGTVKKEAAWYSNILATQAAAAEAAKRPSPFDLKSGIVGVPKPAGPSADIKPQETAPPQAEARPPAEQGPPQDVNPVEKSTAGMDLTTPPEESATTGVAPPSIQEDPRLNDIPSTTQDSALYWFNTTDNI